MIFVKVTAEPVTYSQIILTGFIIDVPDDFVVNPVSPLVLLAEVIPLVVEFIAEHNYKRISV